MVISDVIDLPDILTSWIKLSWLWATIDWNMPSNNKWLRHLDGKMKADITKHTLLSGISKNYNRKKDHPIVQIMLDVPNLFTLLSTLPFKWDESIQCLNRILRTVSWKIWEFDSFIGAVVTINQFETFARGYFFGRRKKGSMHWRFFNLTLNDATVYFTATSWGQRIICHERSMQARQIASKIHPLDGWNPAS